MNKIWVTILLASLGTALVVDPDLAVTAMLRGSHDAVKLALTLVAVYGFWLGLLNLLERIGAMTFVARILSPLIKFLFPGAGADTRKYISVNMSANLLGLGNASTPMGIRAINSMSDQNRQTATTNMIMLVVISATSLQLLPSTVIGMLVEHGSTDPTRFLLPCMAATVLSSILGVMGVKLLSRIWREKAA